MAHVLRSALGTKVPWIWTPKQLCCVPGVGHKVHVDAWCGGCAQKDIAWALRLAPGALGRHCRAGAELITSRLRLKGVPPAVYVGG